MKRPTVTIPGIMVLCFFSFFCCQDKGSGPEDESGFRKLSGPFLGQTPPGDIPEQFAPRLLSGGMNTPHLIFSPDCREMIYSITVPTSRYLSEPKGIFGKSYYLQARMINRHWTEPVEFKFTPENMDYYLSYSPDGKKMFFGSRRKRKEDQTYGGIWYAERTPGGWGEPGPVIFGEDISELGGGYPSVAANGNMYFYKWPKGATHGHLCMSRYENGRYSKVQSLGETVNTPGGAHPFVAPDESYIIFDSHTTGGEEYGGVDLFISYRDQEGQWCRPINMGKNINSPYLDKRPYVSSDGKYLFFASNRISTELPEEPVTLSKIRKLAQVPANGHQVIYWVDAGIIQQLRPAVLN